MADLRRYSAGTAWWFHSSWKIPRTLEVYRGKSGNLKDENWKAPYSYWSLNSQVDAFLTSGIWDFISSGSFESATLQQHSAVASVHFGSTRLLLCLIKLWNYCSKAFIFKPLIFYYNFHRTTSDILTKNFANCRNWTVWTNLILMWEILPLISDILVSLDIAWDVLLTLQRQNATLPFI